MEWVRADAVEASGAEGPSLTEGDAAQKPQRQKPGRDMKEVLDEFAQDNRRKALLDRLEQQLKGTPHVSRLFVGFSITDDRKTQQAIEKEFTAWLASKCSDAEPLGGLLLFIGQAALQLLEGPTELLFQALEFFSRLSAEVIARDSPAPGEPGAKPALLSGLRVLHFTELHGVPVCRSWCGYVHNSKPLGAAQPQLDEATCPELVFTVYNKLLTVALKVQNSLGDKADQSKLEAGYKKFADQLPTADEAANLLSKNAADFLFTYAEFDKVFIAPFHLVLHSELLWPMPPALSY